MTESGMLIITAFSLLFGIYSGVLSLRRSAKKEDRREASDMARVMVKLEDICDGISEIKSDLYNVKGDIKELTERLIVAEQSVKRAHLRLNELKNDTSADIE